MLVPGTAAEAGVTGATGTAGEVRVVPVQVEVGAGEAMAPFLHTSNKARPPMG